MFELVDRDGRARLGRLKTPHGTVETPVLLPVVHPDAARQTIPARELSEAFGVTALITSSYILNRHEVLGPRAAEVGLHRLLDFPGTIMTDSGAFQQHAYGHVEVTPEGILEYQRQIKTDIATVLDEFTEPGTTHDRAALAVEETLRRARKARDARGTDLLAVPVQGGQHADLRLRSAQGASPLGDVLAVGGIVPLMEGYRFADLAQALAAARPGLAPEKPVHLFGLGHPMLFAFGALFGGDIFDSSSYHKFARRGMLMFPEGSIPLDQVREKACGCRLCEKHPLPTLSGLPEGEREAHLTRHNLLQCLIEMGRVRQAIREGTLWELVERRATSHPALMAGLEQALRHPGVFLPVEPASRSSYRVVLPLSRQRPAVQRWAQKLESYREGRPPANALIGPLRPTWGALSKAPPLGGDDDRQWDVPSAFGPVPFELAEIYPAGVAVAPEEFGVTSPEPPLAEPVPVAETPADPPARDHEVAWARRHADAILEWCWGRETVKALPTRTWELRHSRASGRLRALSHGGVVLFTVGNDGLPRPTFPGALVLKEALSPPKARVVAVPDAVPFVSEGRSLFSRHVASADPETVPGSSVLVVDASDRLLAVGRALLAAEEMGRFTRGVAVRVVAHAKAPIPEADLPAEE